MMEIIKLKIIFFEMKICKRGKLCFIYLFLDKRHFGAYNDILILYLLKYLYY